MCILLFLKNTNFAGIVLDPPTIALFPKLCRHNVCNPNTIIKLLCYLNFIDKYGVNEYDANICKRKTNITGTH